MDLSLCVRWSDAPRRRQTGACYVDMGAHSVTNPKSDAPFGSNKNSGTLDLLTGDPDGAFKEIRILSEAFGLTTTLKRLPDICTFIFGEYARSLQQAVDEHRAVISLS